MQESGSEQRIMNGENLKVSVACVVGEPTSAELQVSEFLQNERAVRAVKTLAIYWIIAVAAILVPILHFVLVPLFAVLGLVMAVLAYKKTSQVMGGEIRCPGCQQAFAISKGPVAWPHKEICPNCRYQLEIAPTA